MLLKSSEKKWTLEQINFKAILRLFVLALVEKKLLSIFIGS